MSRSLQTRAAGSDSLSSLTPLEKTTCTVTADSPSLHPSALFLHATSIHRQGLTQDRGSQTPLNSPAFENATWTATWALLSYAFAS